MKKALIGLWAFAVISSVVVHVAIHFYYKGLPRAPVPMEEVDRIWLEAKDLSTRPARCEGPTEQLELAFAAIREVPVCDPDGNELSELQPEDWAQQQAALDHLATWAENDGGWPPETDGHIFSTLPLSAATLESESPQHRSALLTLLDRSLHCGVLAESLGAATIIQNVIEAEDEEMLNELRTLELTAPVLGKAAARGEFYYRALFARDSYDLDRRYDRRRWHHVERRYWARGARALAAASATTYEEVWAALELEADPDDVHTSETSARLFARFQAVSDALAAE